MRTWMKISAVLLLLPLASCGGGGGGTPQPVSLVSISITPVNPTVPRGATQQLTATGQYSDGSTVDVTNGVTWSSGNGFNFTINTSTGLATAINSGTIGGTSVITATVGGITATSTLTVGNPNLVSITVTAANLTVPRGTSSQFTATGNYSDATTANLTGSSSWSSGTTANAIIGAATGLAAVPNNATLSGTSLISATNGGITGTATLTVGNPNLVSIAVTPANPTVARGKTQQFTATGTFSDANTANLTSAGAFGAAAVTWSSATTTNATITAGGLATAVNGGTVGGTSVISAVSGGITGTTTLTVGAAVLASIAVTPANPTVPRGTTQQFTATGTMSDGTAATLGAITWTSVTTTNATFTSGVNNTAVFTAVNGGTIGGTSVIQAVSGGVTGSTILTVGNPNLVSIVVTPANPTVPRGTTQQFTATGNYSDATTANLSAVATWSSATTTNATILNGASGGLATAVNGGTIGGTSVISAVSGGITGTTTLTVGNPNLVSVSVTPANPFVVGGATQQFTATGNYSDATTANLTATATWSITGMSPDVTLSAGGLATVGQFAPLGNTWTITATAGVAGNTVLTVDAPVWTYNTQVAPTTSVANGLYYYAVTFPAAGAYVIESNAFVGAYLDRKLTQPTGTCRTATLPAGCVFSISAATTVYLLVSPAGTTGYTLWNGPSSGTLTQGVALAGSVALNGNLYYIINHTVSVPHTITLNGLTTDANITSNMGACTANTGVTADTCTATNTGWSWVKVIGVTATPFTIKSPYISQGTVAAPVVIPFINVVSASEVGPNGTGSSYYKFTFTSTGTHTAALYDATGTLVTTAANLLVYSDTGYVTPWGTCSLGVCSFNVTVAGTSAYIKVTATAADATGRAVYVMTK
ncbi:MAG: Ig-like domain-containing protein [Deltaproteobacteria bacterium]|nr:Ig-like domain-containing protein [Deltaproteobacteria bacterium]